MHPISKNEVQKNEVIISGKVSDLPIKEVTFSLLMDKLINADKNSYVAALDSSSQFSITIPIKQITEAKIILGNGYHEMCFLPGDSLYIEIVGREMIKYQGVGAGKNNFLFASEVKWFKDRMSKTLSDADVDLASFPDSIKAFIRSQNALAEKYDKEQKLEPEFKELLKLKDELTYPGLLLDYPARYAMKQKMPIDSVKLPQEYQKARVLKNALNDKLLGLEGYRNLINNLISNSYRQILKAEPTLKTSQIQQRLILDSLKGKTKEYFLTYFLVNGLKQNKYDSTLYSRFKETVKDSVFNARVQTSYEKYKLRSEIIGKPLNAEFTETMLVDTANTQISFGEMMEKYKGKVVFLDIWSLNCGPCRANMPFSQQLKKQFKGQPVEFVYIAQDPPANDVWKNIFTVTQTKQNQYRMVDHQWGSARMLKFLEISFVPCYMIFDKEGKLVDYNAEQPMVKNEKGELVIGARLKKLAEL